MEEPSASNKIQSLVRFLSQHIHVTDDLRIEGCDGSLSLTALWLAENHIKASSGLDWIKAHGPDCNCDCEIYSYLQDHTLREDIEACSA